MNEIPWWLPSSVALFIAVLGIFQEQIRKLLFGARLSLWFDAESLVDSHVTSLNASLPERLDVIIPTFWTRLRVVNSGRTAAHGVRVVIKEVWRKDNRGRYRLDSKFTPMNLKWTHIGEWALDVLPPGLEQFCDLLHIPDPQRAIAEGFNIGTPGIPTAHLELQVHPNSRPGLLEPGDYRLVLLVVANDVSPRAQVVELTVPLEWSMDEAVMQRAMNLRGLPKLSPLQPLLPE